MAKPFNCSCFKTAKNCEERRGLWSDVIYRVLMINWASVASEHHRHIKVFQSNLRMFLVCAAGKTGWRAAAVVSYISKSNADVAGPPNHLRTFASFPDGKKFLTQWFSGCARTQTLWYTPLAKLVRLIELHFPGNSASINKLKHRRLSFT